MHWRVLDPQDAPAAYGLLPSDIGFNAQGRRVDAVSVIVECQGGVPYTVHRPQDAVRKHIWAR